MLFHVHGRKCPSLCLPAGMQKRGCPPSDVFVRNCAIRHYNPQACKWSRNPSSNFSLPPWGSVNIWKGNPIAHLPPPPSGSMNLGSDNPITHLPPAPSGSMDPSGSNPISHLYSTSLISSREDNVFVLNGIARPSAEDEMWQFSRDGNQIFYNQE